MRKCVEEEGITSVKVFMAYRGAIGVDDQQAFAAGLDNLALQSARDQHQRALFTAAPLSRTIDYLHACGNDVPDRPISSR